MQVGRPTVAALVPAIAAALVAAIVGGIVWGLIVKATDYEIGFAAWGIGALVGFAVLLAARGARGLPYQVIAVVAALVGIALGKYLAFVYSYREQVETDASMFSGEMFDAFRLNLDLVFSAFDLLWAGLAVLSAWQILRPVREPHAENA